MEYSVMVLVLFVLDSRLTYCYIARLEPLIVVIEKMSIWSGMEIYLSCTYTCFSGINSDVQLEVGVYSHSDISRYVVTM